MSTKRITTTFAALLVAFGATGVASAKPKPHPRHVARPAATQPQVPPQLGDSRIPLPGQALPV